MGHAMYHLLINPHIRLREVGVPLLPTARPGDPKTALLSPHAGIQPPAPWAENGKGSHMEALPKRVRQEGSRSKATSRYVSEKLVETGRCEVKDFFLHTGPWSRETPKV